VTPTGVNSFVSSVARRVTLSDALVRKRSTVSRWLPS
jgi:hypothetical protein